MRCKICRKRIKWDKSKLYRVKITPSTLQMVAGARSTIYDAIDCERCGIQNIISVRETELVGNDIEQVCADEMSDEREQDEKET